MYPHSLPIVEHRVTDELVPFTYNALDEDALTGIPNRRAMNDALEHAVHDERLAGNFGIVVVDLNDFKEEVNDLHGHDEGDRYLENAASALKDSIRPEDVASLVTRFGGDELVILLSGVNETSVLNQIIERLHANLDEIGVPNAMGGKVHEPGETATQLLDAADKLMYTHKRKQRIENLSPEQISAYGQIEKIAREADISLRGIASTIAALRAGIGE